MTYLGLLRVVGVADSTAGYQFNTFLPGTGWDVLVSQATAAQSAVCIYGTWPRLTQFEVLQAHLDGPVGSSVLVMINRQPWNHVLQGWQNYNDPQQPWPVRLERPGQRVVRAGPGHRRAASQSANVTVPRTPGRSSVSAPARSARPSLPGTARGTRTVRRPVTVIVTS